MPLPTRIGRLRPPVLCFVVSAETTKDLQATVASAVAGGVTMVRTPLSGSPGLAKPCRPVSP